MTTETEYDTLDQFEVSQLRKYRNYDDRRLLSEFNYLRPIESDPWDAATSIGDMDYTDLAHFYAVTMELARRLDQDD